MVVYGAMEYVLNMAIEPFMLLHDCSRYSTRVSHPYIFHCDKLGTELQPGIEEPDRQTDPNVNIQWPSPEILLLSSIKSWSPFFFKCCVFQFLCYSLATANPANRQKNNSSIYFWCGPVELFFPHSDIFRTHLLRHWTQNRVRQFWSDIFGQSPDSFDSG